MISYWDIQGPLGFKVLQVKDGGIYSVLAPFAWRASAVKMDACQRCGSARPGEGCSCGLHATYSAGHAIDQYLVHHLNGVLVLVEGQGQVILHERGWRAEQCAVHAIVELDASNTFKHMQVVGAKMELGVACSMSLEEAINLVQIQQQRIPA